MLRSMFQDIAVELRCILNAMAEITPPTIILATALEARDRCLIEFICGLLNVAGSTSVALDTPKVTVSVFCVVQLCNWKQS